MLYLDLNSGKYDTGESLREQLNLNLCECEALYGTNDAEKSLASRFAGVVERACKVTGARAVMEVDWVKFYKLCGE